MKPNKERARKRGKNDAHHPSQDRYSHPVLRLVLTPCAGWVLKQPKKKSRKNSRQRREAWEGEARGVRVRGEWREERGERETGKKKTIKWRRYYFLCRQKAIITLPAQRATIAFRENREYEIKMESTNKDCWSLIFLV